MNETYDKPIPCPKCGRLLQPSGVVTTDGGDPLTAYQCDECLVTAPLFGKPMEMALTFAVDATGKVVAGDGLPGSPPPV